MSNCSQNPPRHLGTGLSAQRVLPPFVKKAVLFGSYAKGTASEKSDIDLLVDSGLRGFRFISLCEDIRRALGREIDLINVSHIEANSKIDREISATGVIIYEQ